MSAYDAALGKYKVRLSIGDFSQTQDFELKIHPNILSSIPNGAALNQTIENWIAVILQKAMRTGQHNYQFEARLLP